MREPLSQTKVLNNVSNISSASPKARKFARELGVDINKVLGSERDGFFKIIKLKDTYEKPSEKKKRILQENIKRVKKLNKLKNRF